MLHISGYFRFIYSMTLYCCLPTYFKHHKFSTIFEQPRVYLISKSTIEVLFIKSYLNIIYH